MFVSVIVPLYNDSQRMVKLLTSLEKQTYPRDSFEIIVVDNGSDQDTGHLASRFNIRPAYETNIRSSYAARNKGIGMARGDILCFTDSDCTAGENWIAEGVKALEEKEADLVGGNVVFTLSPKKRASEFYDAITNMQIETIVRERGVAITANLFVRKHVIDTIGLFSHHLKSGGDIYFTAQAVQSGFRLVYSPEAYVSHPARPFLRLLKKSMRVGNGKSRVHKLSNGTGNETVLPRNVLRGKRPLDHLNPLAIKERLKKTGYRVGFFKFLSILLVSYCYLATMLLSRVMSNLMD